MGGVLIARVVVDQAVYRIDKPYDYILPDDLTFAKPGCRVLVPFGRGIGTRQGLLIEVCDFSEYPESKLKRIISVLDDKPILSEEMLELSFWLKKRTFCTYFDALRVLLPLGISLKTVILYSYNKDQDDNYTLSEDEKRIIEYLKNSPEPKERDKLLSDFGFSVECNILERLCKLGFILRNDTAVRKMGDASLKMVRLTDAEPQCKLTAKQSEIVELLRQTECGSVKELCYFTGISQGVIKTLEKKGVVELYNQEVYRKPYDYGTPEETPIVLSDEQLSAYNYLVGEYKKGYSVNLIFGVTGSGKTQVFLRMADDVVAEGKGVIVMVPEIALTPQTIAIFNKRYGDKVAVFHSAMSLGQRMDEWKRIKNGEALIAIGTRSAVFAPFSNLGLIIIDEEQEHTYKSEQTPKFHARDVAKFRASYNKCMLILASATPSVETYSAALSGRYNLCKLTRRYGKSELPQVVTVDMRNEREEGNKTVISEFLLNSLTDVLNSGKQAILLLNRRGYNTFVSCASCGEVVTCPNCSISMTYHSANGRLVCHYCGHSVPYTSKCPKCSGEHMKYLGIGTQRVEDELKGLYPNARVLRMDADSTMTKTAYEKNLSAFSRGEYDIMLGTQMVAKGLNFPNVTLVGVLSSDRSLYSDDFRSFEKTFSLLTQVVGRSGRGSAPGMAVIQTINPENEIIRLAAEQNYEAFYETEIMNRKLMIYPPYCEIAMIVLQSEARKNAQNAANFVFKTMVDKINLKYPEIKVNILGPSIASIPKVNNKYRYRLIVKFRGFEKFSLLLRETIDEFYESEYNKTATVSVDINPENIV